MSLFIRLPLFCFLSFSLPRSCGGAAESDGGVGGAGGVESVFTIKALEEQVSPPTINVFEQDPECDIDCCPNEARRMEINYAMKNSFGFGGTNSTVIYKRWTE